MNQRTYENWKKNEAIRSIVAGIEKLLLVAPLLLTNIIIIVSLD
jgi:hypothetical protein